MRFEDTFIGRPNTVKTKKSLFNNWVFPHFNPNIAIMYDAWEKAGLKPNTLLSLISLTKEYMIWLEKTQGQSCHYSNDFRTVALRHPQDKKPILTQDQVDLLIKECYIQDIKLYKPLIISLHTGMRKGEVFGLRNKDINLNKKIITISRSYDGPTKNGKSRVVPISGLLLKTLKKKGPAEDKVIPLFEPNYRLGVLCTKLKLPRITFHTLRHIFATLALESGVSPKTVQTILGHSNLSTTLNIYWDLMYEEIDLGFLPTGRPM